MKRKRKNILTVLKNKVLIYDGAMGTMLHKMGLAAGICPEEWNLSHPDIIRRIHRAYVAAGAVIVETNSFGANRIALGKYGLGNKCARINRTAAAIARKEAPYVAASVGPLPAMVEPLGKITYQQALDVFKEQIKALYQGRPDLILLETFSDIKELKIAVIAAREAGDLPIQAQMTYSALGTTISGTTPEVAVKVLESLGVEIIGTNCSLGPAELVPIVKRIAGSARKETFISVLPNAGLPQMVKGRTEYGFPPAEMARYAQQYYRMGVNLVGGCCGTQPEHIKEIAKRLSGKRPIARKKKVHLLTAASRTRVLELAPRVAPYIIGERINPSRRPDLAGELHNKKTKLIRAEAKQQARAGADLIDINVSTPGIDEPEAMKRAVSAVEQSVKVPVVIDSGEALALEAGLKEYCGKAVINSVTGERKRMGQILPLAKKYGAAVIALTLDETGIPMTVNKRVQIARRIIKQAQRYGIHREDILIDFLTLTAGAQPKSTPVTLRCLAIARKRGWQTVLGVSNISFGLPDRQSINSAFLTLASHKGLSAAIINPQNIRVKETIRAYNLLFGVEPAAAKAEKDDRSDPLFNCILTGDKDNIGDLIDEYLLAGRNPLDINQKILIPALEEVGRRFDAREYFLPQLLLAAESMQAAVKKLARAFPRHNVKKGARILMATVEGDLHDIGKNIVCVVLRNYGYDVVDLGKNVSCEKIVKAAEGNKADIIGLSSLMTTTMGQMELVINELKKRGINIPTIVGGAVVSSSYAGKIGADEYAVDAVTAVKKIKKILQKKKG